MPRSGCRSSRPEGFCKKGVLRSFAKFVGKHLRKSLFFNKVAGLRTQTCNFIKKETLAQVFSCAFCEISKNTFFYRITLVAASVVVQPCMKWIPIKKKIYMKMDSSLSEGPSYEAGNFNYMDEKVTKNRSSPNDNSRRYDLIVCP